MNLHALRRWYEEVRRPLGAVSRALSGIARDFESHYRFISRDTLSFGLMLLRLAILVAVLPWLWFRDDALTFAWAAGLLLWAAVLASRRSVHKFCIGSPVLCAFIDALVVLLLCVTTGYETPFFLALVTPLLTLAVYFGAEERAVRRTILQATVLLVGTYIALAMLLYWPQVASRPIVLYERVLVLALIGVVSAFSAVLLQGHIGLYESARALHVRGHRRQSVVAVSVATCAAAKEGHEAIRLVQAEARGDDAAAVRRLARLLALDSTVGGRPLFVSRGNPATLDDFGLTETERAVLRCRALGMDEVEISRQPGMATPITIASHLDHISAKTGYRSGPWLTGLAIDGGLISDQDLVEYTREVGKRRRIRL